MIHLVSKSPSNKRKEWFQTTVLFKRALPLRDAFDQLIGWPGLEPRPGRFRYRWLLEGQPLGGLLCGPCRCKQLEPYLSKQFQSFLPNRHIIHPHFKPP
jgi:hypothetical protein